MRELVAWNTLAVSLLVSQPSIVGNHSKCVEDTINDVVPRLTVPESHDQEQGYITEVGNRNFVFDPFVFDHCKHQTHIDEIREPE